MSRNVATVVKARPMRWPDPTLEPHLPAWARYDEAIDQFSEALRIDPNLEQVRVNRERAIQMKSLSKGK